MRAFPRDISLAEYLDWAAGHDSADPDEDYDPAYTIEEWRAGIPPRRR